MLNRPLLRFCEFYFYYSLNYYDNENKNKNNKKKNSLMNGMMTIIRLNKKEELALTEIAGTCGDLGEPPGSTSHNYFLM